MRSQYGCGQHASWRMASLRSDFQTQLVQNSKNISGKSSVVNQVIFHANVLFDFERDHFLVIWGQLSSGLIGNRTAFIWRGKRMLFASL